MADKKKTKKKESAQQVADKYSTEAQEAWAGPTPPADQFRDAWGSGVDMGPYGPASGGSGLYAPQLGDPRMNYAGGPSGEELRQAIAVLMQSIGRR